MPRKKVKEEEKIENQEPAPVVMEEEEADFEEVAPVASKSDKSVLIAICASVFVTIAGIGGYFYFFAPAKSGQDKTVIINVEAKENSEESNKSEDPNKKENNKNDQNKEGNQEEQKKNEEPAENNQNQAEEDDDDEVEEDNGYCFSLKSRLPIFTIEIILTHVAYAIGLNKGFINKDFNKIPKGLVDTLRTVKERFFPGEGSADDVKDVCRNLLVASVFRFCVFEIFDFIITPLILLFFLPKGSRWYHAWTRSSSTRWLLCDIILNIGRSILILLWLVVFFIVFVLAVTTVLGIHMFLNGLTKKNESNGEEGGAQANN